MTREENTIKFNRSGDFTTTQFIELVDYLSSSADTTPTDVDIDALTLTYVGDEEAYHNALRSIRVFDPIAFSSMIEESITYKVYDLDKGEAPSNGYWVGCTVIKDGKRGHVRRQKTVEKGTELYFHNFDELYSNKPVLVSTVEENTTVSLGAYTPDIVIGRPKKRFPFKR